MKAIVGGEAVVTVTADDVTAAIGLEGVSEGSYSYEFTDQGEGWYRGLLRVNNPHAGAGAGAADADACAPSLTVDIRGGPPLDVQIGQVAITPNGDPRVCPGSSCPAAADPDAGCPVQPPPGALRTFLDGGDSTAGLFASENVAVARDHAARFAGDTARLARRDATVPASLTYRFDDGGISRVRVAVALRFGTPSAREQIRVQITPYTLPACKPPPYNTNFAELAIHDLSEGWSTVEVEYFVGPLPSLGCQLPRYVDLGFSAPPGSDVQLMHVELIGAGAIGDLEEVWGDASAAGATAQPPAAVGAVFGAVAMALLHLLR